jgi:hypothetical protein
LKKDFGLKSNNIRTLKIKGINNWGWGLNQ